MNWNFHFNRAIEQFDFVVLLELESCVYNKVNQSFVVLLELYVDDILNIENILPMFNSVNVWLRNFFF